MKKRNEIVSIILIIGLVFSMFLSSVSYAKSKPSLSKTKVTIDLNASIICDEVKITGVKKSVVKDVKAKSTNNSVATTDVDENAIQIYGESKGNCKVNVTIILKKKIGGKNNYKKSISVTVKDTSSPVVTSAPTVAPTTAPIPTAAPTIAPTTAPIPTATPTIVPTSDPISSKNNNINKLKQYIISNGKKDEDKDGKQYYYCVFSGKEIDDDLSLLIHNYIEDGSFKFVYVMDGKTQSMGTLKCQSDMCGLAFYEFFVPKPSTILTNASIPIETIQKNESFDFDISFPFNPSITTKASVTKVSNTSLHLLLTSFNYIFETYFDFSINEIGFNSYV